MKNNIDFIKGFFSRSGSYVFSAAVVARLLSFAASWVVLQLISNKELGIVIFSFSIISFIIPFGGLGLYQGLIRYGALLNSEVEKESLFIYVFKNGLITTSLLVLILIFCSLFIPFKYESTGNYLIVLSFVLIPHYLLSIIKIQFRLKHDNKTFSFIEITYNSLLFITVLSLSYFFNAKGYALALLIAPCLTALIYLRKLNIDFSQKKILNITDYSFWKYGFFASLAVSVAQFLIAIDIVLIGYLMNNSEAVTQYKYVSLIPFSLLFLSQVFINTDFVTFTEKIKNKNFIFNYIKRYMIFFSFVSITICGFSFLFSHQILLLLDPSFVQFSTAFLILIVGICGILIFRGLFGNLLSSIGKVHINYYIGGAALILNIISNYFLIPKFGITGAAITTAVLMWITGIISCVWFLHLYKNLKNIK
tara:strand:+ start:7411 stop:8673 length:1263 start_codon:yes stop_codon:yes gene_type:complete